MQDTPTDSQPAGPSTLAGLSFPRQGWRHTWGAALLLVLPVLIIYIIQTWSTEFIWDDDAHITQNPAVTKPGGIIEIWTTAAARICPLTLSSFWLEHSLWGLNPRLFHLVSILLHAGAALVLWRVLLRLRVPGAWFGAALWALHPVQVETAAWITEQKNTLSGLFYLLTILFFVRSEQRPGVRDYGMAVLCGLLASLSKSSTVVLPVVLALCAWWVHGRWPWKVAVKLVPFVIFAAGVAALSIWTQSVEGAHGLPFQRGLLQRLADAGKVVWFDLWKLLWPSPLTFIYPKWQTDVSSLLHWLPVLAGIAVTLIAWWRRWWSVLFAWILFIVQLGPVLTLVDHYFLRYSLVGDHFQYLACTAPLALIAAGIMHGMRRLQAIARHAVVALVLLVCAVISWHEAAEYRSSEVLWEATLRDNPDAWMAHNNLGLVLREQGRKDEALKHHLRAVEIEPGLAHEPHHDLGNLLAEMGRMDEAILEHQKGLAILETYHGLTNLAATLLAAGRANEAVINFELALELRPRSAQAHLNLGIALGQAGEPQSALERLQHAATLDPTMAEIPFQMGNIFMAQNHSGEAIEAFQEALELDPGHVEASWNLGGLLNQQGDSAGAVAAFTQVAEKEPDNAQAWNNLAWLHATGPENSVRDGAKALKYAEKACALTQRQDPRMLRALAAALAETGDFTKAESVCQEASRISGDKPDQLLLIEREASLYRSRSKWRRL